MTQKRLEIVQLSRRVHIGQHTSSAKHRDVFSIDHVHPQVLKEISHLQAMLGQMPQDRRMAGSAVDRAQGMISAFGARHDSIYQSGQLEQPAQKVRRDQRHIASHQQQFVVARGGKRGVQTAQRTAAGHAIVDQPDAGETFILATADDHDVIGQVAQRIELTFDDSPAADDQLALIAAAEASRLTAGKNCGTGHSSAILPPG